MKVNQINIGLLTLEDENIVEQQNYDDSVIGDQLADACDLIKHMVSEKIDDERVKKIHKTFGYSGGKAL